MKEILGEYGMLLLTAAVALCVTVFVLRNLLGAEGVLKEWLGAFADGLLGG
ncbi:hypothetical protein MCG98_04745 [Ruminococcus sp. OA3]|uniref:hypothetical protein n=1 Tax=Ruminococcus sp. OA3 TaxID=2914164 RepID=UPI001F06A1AD|nr:hypothetical protein [Ruminococcus sp. OA3]MCH1981879.1 hypothetical protein [Ruminococcus sp. OA3]